MSRGGPKQFEGRADTDPSTLFRCVRGFPFRSLGSWQIKRGTRNQPGFTIYDLRFTMQSVFRHPKWTPKALKSSPPPQCYRGHNEIQEIRLRAGRRAL